MRVFGLYISTQPPATHDLRELVRKVDTIMVNLEGLTAAVDQTVARMGALQAQIDLEPEQQSAIDALTAKLQAAQPAEPVPTHQ